MSRVVTTQNLLINVANALERDQSQFGLISRNKMEASHDQHNAAPVAELDPPEHRTSVATCMFNRESGMAILRMALTGVTGLYWLAMLWGTHMRMPPSSVEVNDKLMHFAAYFVLTALLVFGNAMRGRLDWRTMVQTFLIVAVYGIFDELTQPLFGRDGEVLDWLGDVAGAFTAILVTFGLYQQIIGFASRSTKETRPAVPAASIEKA